MWIKSIIQGRLEFGNEKSYDKVLKMYGYRAENYYKNDVIFKEEDIFFEDGYYLEIKRFVSQVSEKSFKNTMNLLSYCAQFAVSGNIQGWLTDTGTVLAHSNIEPRSDKAVVQYFLKGKKLVKTSGEQEKAIAALSKAIEKYSKHSQAYERRAKVNYMMKKYHDAMRDYNKSLGIDSTNPAAYYGRAKVHIINGNLEEAIKDLELTTKNAIALQDIYWKARRIKAKCHMDLEQFEKAAFDLKLFYNREFSPESDNYQWVSYVAFQYGRVLLELGEFDAAIKAFDKSLSLRSSLDRIPDADKFFYRGIAKKKAGKNGAIKDINEAKALGFEKADELAARLLKQK